MVTLPMADENYNLPRDGDRKHSKQNVLHIEDHTIVATPPDPVEQYT
jgi:hypothetical protein